MSTVSASLDRTGDRRLHVGWALAIGALVYLGIAAAMYAHVLSLSITHGTTCACSDTSLFAWFFEWPLVALSHGHNPFYSSAMFHPRGINLLSNTSVTSWSFLLLPVTAIFGPIASLNVALLLAPAVTGTVTMWVALRWVESRLAAFVAGALYAFSPLVLFQAAGSHLMVTFLAVPPLVLACLDELFWRRRRPPLSVGAALGALLVVQFFSGTELLVILLVTTAACLAMLLVVSSFNDRAATIEAVRSGAPGVGVAAAICLVVLAVPAWYALEGPGHYVGAVWPNISPAQASLRSFVIAVPGSILWWVPHWGRFMRPTYLGPLLIATLVAGVALFRLDRRLRALVAMTAVVAWLALGERYSFAAWHYLRHLVVLENVMNERFAALLFLPAGLGLALVLDDVRRWRKGVAGAAIAVVIGAACVTPFVLNATRGLPYSASRVWEPLWYTRNADALSPREVILGFPFFNTSADLLAVQALHSMHYSIVGGTGPEWIDARQGAQEPGYRVIEAISSTAVRPVLGTQSTPAERVALRDALAGWGVTLIVLPVNRGPNTSVVARPPAELKAWLSTVLGPPRLADAAWVWRVSR
ncbi:MAG TPA: hypothetical protein VIE15_01805 [Acidimicrobiales bacterium]